MKNKIIVLLVFVMSGITWASTLNNVRVLGNEVSDTSTVRAFFRPKAKTAISHEQLLAECERSVTKMQNAQWFYKANCMVVESFKNPGQYNVFLDVEDGYRHRFWGGNAFGGYGMVNVGGLGWEYSVELGANRQILEIQRFWSNWHPWQLRFKVGHFDTLAFLDMPSVHSDTTVNTAESRVAVGYDLGKDWNIWLELGWQKYWKIDAPSFILNSTWSLIKDSRNHTYSPTAGQQFIFESTVFNAQKSYQFLGDLRHYYSPHPKITLALRAMGKRQEFPELQARLGLHYYDGVRSPAATELVGKWNFLTQGEIRWRAGDLSLLGLLNMSFEPLLFIDKGFAAQNYAQLKKLDLRTAEAGGLGLRIWFGAPVFVPLRLEYGWDRDKKGEFFLALEKSF